MTSRLDQRRLNAAKWDALLKILYMDLTDACSLGALRFLQRSMDIDCISLHVKFEDRLSISVSRNRATLLQKKWSSKP
jgi:hypothetical protein